MPKPPKKLIAFGWYGGKFSHLDWLLPLLLDDANYFCEPYGGSAAVLLNRIPAPVETYNDLDGEVVNFFRVLRTQKDELIEAIGMTPFSRDELALAAGNQTDGITDLERARRFFVCARQARMGMAQVASAGRWAHCVLNSRAGMAAAVSRWLGSVEALPEIAHSASDPTSLARAHAIPGRDFTGILTGLGSGRQWDVETPRPGSLTAQIPPMRAQG
jgi:DNA adenine methylase